MGALKEIEASSQPCKQRLVRLLARIYLRSRLWERVRGRSPLDVFQHRVLASSYAPSISEFIEQLCRKLGVQSLELEPGEVEELEECGALQLLRKESIVLVAEMYNYVRSSRGGRS
ncbi:MAG: hypothetical protein DRJ96_07610 [Thermoprotei archaeon]|nr:MAG: hypothetical protein DRJ67_08640 [Thermoprotei archaeon]RLE95986.1 MAG: hypothetical protein DRJ96_07610 [Thermoprotei archaeon]